MNFNFLYPKLLFQKLDIFCFDYVHSTEIKALQLIQEGKTYFMLGHTKCFPPSVSHSLFTTVLWLLLSEVYLLYWHFFPCLK